MAEVMTESSEIHRRAVRNFERVIRIARISGMLLAGMGIAFGIADITGLFEWQLDEPFWLRMVRQGTCQLGAYLLLFAYAYPRLVPTYRMVVTEAEQQAYRRFLYEFGRPLREQLPEMLVLSALMLPPLSVLLLAMIASRVWPEQQQVITGIAILAGLGAFVLAIWLADKRMRGVVDAWYAAHFPSENR